MAERETPRRLPARPIIGWLLVAGGFLALLAGYLGVSRNALVAKQLPYLVSGGLVGIALVFLGGLLLGVHDLGRMARRVDRMESQIADLHAVLLERAEQFEPKPNGDRPVVTVLAGGRTFHQADCSVVNGKQGIRKMAVADASAQGLTPCKLCSA